MKACKGTKLSIQQRIANFLLTCRSTKHPTTGRTPASLFLGRELRTRLTLLRPRTGEKVLDSQSKQKATHDVHIKFREFYPGDRILVKDLRRENTWWPGSVAERSAPKSYVVILDDGRVWKRHPDHIRRDSPDSAVPKQDIASDSQASVSHPPRHAPISTDVHLPPQLPASIPVMDPAEAGTKVQPEKEKSPTTVTKSLPVDTPSSEVAQTPLRRSSRVRKAPDRLVETM